MSQGGGGWLLIAAVATAFLLLLIGVTTTRVPRTLLVAALVLAWGGLVSYQLRKIAGPVSMFSCKEEGEEKP